MNPNALRCCAVTVLMFSLAPTAPAATKAGKINVQAVVPAPTTPSVDVPADGDVVPGVQGVQPQRPLVPPMTKPPEHRPMPPIYYPPVYNSGSVYDPSRPPLPCNTSPSVVSGKMYYICDGRYFIEVPSAKGPTYEEVPAPY